MPSRTDERPRVEQDRVSQSGTPSIDEPRNSAQPSPEIDTQPCCQHQGFDADLNPIDDEFINTHGSER